MSVNRSAAVAVCLLLLVGAVTAPVAALAGTGGIGGTGGTASGGAPVASVGVTGSSASAFVQANNTTRHRNPNERSESGDLAAVRDHLAGEMRRVIVDCSQAVRIGEFDPCEQLNGTYADSLSKYAEVTRETGAGNDESARSFREVGRESGTYARDVRRFRETYEEYREARESGNVTRARRAARELRSLAEETDRTGGNLSRSLRNVTRGGTDVRSAGREVNETTANVTRTIGSIERELFEGTNTTANLESPVGSFRDPLVITGRVTTANGTAVEDERVGIFRVRNGSVGERVRARALTNATGHYRLVYRPVTVAAGGGSFAVRLLPSAESPYLPSNATVTARIEQVEANLTVTAVPETSAYGDRIRVRTRVTSGDVPVDRLPVAARIDEYLLGRDRTDDRGEAVPDGRLSTVVMPGERTILVGYEERDRAIAPVTESVDIEILETTTAIEVIARSSTDRSVVFDGRLTTADGRPLDNRTVRVTVAGRSMGTFRTDANGSFGGNLTVPASVLPVEGSAERSVRLAFDGSGTNLGPTETSASVTLVAPAEESPLPVDDTALVLSLVALLLLLGIAGIVFLGRRSPTEGRPTPRAPASSEGGASARPSIDPSAVLDGIRTAMDAGDYDLVTTAGYRAARRALAGRVAAPPEATHWEFYGACAADGFDPARLEAVRRLTERFERVAFASEHASQSVAAGALADVERVLGADAGGLDEPDPAEPGDAADRR